MKIKEENFFSVQGWMRTKLGLSGNDLIVYAIIYGFSQTEDQKFTGSLQYLADWCGATKQGILKNLKNLVDKGLISRENKIIKGVNCVEYYSTKLNGAFNLVERGIQLSLTNNIIDNKANIEDISLSKDKDMGHFEFGKVVNKTLDNENAKAFVKLYEEKCFNLPKVSKLTDARIKAINKLTKKYEVADILKVFELANESDFLTGRNDRGWKANIDFILREDKFINILEGKYGGRQVSKKQTSTDIGRTSERAKKGEVVHEKF